MNSYTNIFFRKPVNLLRDIHFWLIILLVILLSLFYYLVQYYHLSIYARYPFIQTFIIWEYVHCTIGSLFYFPILFSVFLFWWRGTLVVWALSFVLNLPRIIFFYGGNFDQIFINVFTLSILLIILGYVSFELSRRERERRLAKEKEQERVRYLSEVFKAHEDGRKNLAREIHDDPIQRLAVIASEMENLSDDPRLEHMPDLKKRTLQVQGSILRVSKDLRRITMDLRPTVLDDLGLIPALQWLVNDFKQESKISSHFELIGKEKLVSVKTADNIFRIVQQALTNIKQHANATNVTVIVNFSEQMLIVTIEDNGCGFNIPDNLNDLVAYSKLGILGMQQRAEFINGKLYLYSQINQGTSISVEVGI
jgi:two-component system, NarL family, sensor histidine kinase DegS